LTTCSIIIIESFDIRNYIFWLKFTSLHIMHFNMIFWLKFTSLHIMHFNMIRFQKWLEPIIRNCFRRNFLITLVIASKNLFSGFVHAGLVLMIMLIP